MNVRMAVIRIASVVASLLLHVVAYRAILVAPGWTYSREEAVVAELVQADPPRPAPEMHTELPKLTPQRLMPPKPIDAPPPKIAQTPVETARAEPPTPAPVTPTSAPAATPSAPAVLGRTAASGAGPLAPGDAPLSTTGDGLPTQAGPPVPVQSAPGIAALLPDAVTQTTIPRGGYQVKPSYPASARRAGVQGTTLLNVFVATDGRVDEIVVKQSAGHPDLDRAAADAVRRWRFEPARRGVEAVAMWVLLPVEFRLH